jgi:hypothetical protein
VILDERLTSAERRFTLTHELVHFVLHPGARGSTPERPGEEYQADEGAAELLMPYRDIIPRAAAMRRRLREEPSSALTALAAVYRLNCEYVRRRIVSLDAELLEFSHGTPVAAIVPKTGGAAFHAPAPEFLRAAKSVDISRANVIFEEHF